MGKLLFSLGIIIGALVIGQIVFRGVRNKQQSAIKKAETIVFRLRDVAFFGMGPLLTIIAMWMVDISNISIIAVPFLGLGALLFGSFAALAASSVLKHTRKQKGAMFASGSCSNIGTIGALLCFTFFGEAGFAYTALYKIFELPYYYLVLYPIARGFSDQAASAKTENKLLRLLKDPIIVLYFSGILIGFLLNFFHVPLPAVFREISSYLVPVSSLLMITAIGYTMRFSKIGHYLKEITAISIIKYLLTPTLIITVSLILGLDKIANGILFASLVFLSALPSGFNSLIPAQLYHLDIDLANSNWIVTTGLLVIVVPVIWLFVG